jgi:hypothetical protein
MKIFKVISAVTLSVVLAGCINLPQTKALITPVGAVGIHSFAPPAPTPRGVDFPDARRVAQRADQQPEQPQG